MSRYVETLAWVHVALIIIIVAAFLTLTVHPVVVVATDRLRAIEAAIYTIIDIISVAIEAGRSQRCGERLGQIVALALIGKGRTDALHSMHCSRSHLARYQSTKDSIHACVK